MASAPVHLLQGGWSVSRGGALAQALDDHNEGRRGSWGAAAASMAGALHRHALDEPRSPGATRLDTREYDERGEASHKGGVKIA